MSGHDSRYQSTGETVGRYQLAVDQTLAAPVLLHRLAGAAEDPLITARVRALRGRRHSGALTLIDASADGADLVVVYDAAPELQSLTLPVHYRDLLDHASGPIAALASWHQDGLSVGQLRPDAILVGPKGHWRLVPPVKDATDDDLREVGLLLHGLLSNLAPANQTSLNDNPSTLADGRPLPDNLDRLISDLLSEDAPSRPPGLNELGHRLRAAAGMANPIATSATVQIPQDLSHEIDREFPERPTYVSGNGLNWGWLFLAVVAGVVATLVIFLRPDQAPPTDQPPPIENSREEAAVPADKPPAELAGKEAPPDKQPAVAPEPKPDPAALAAMQSAFEAMLGARAEAEAVGAPSWAPKRWQAVLELIRAGDVAKAADKPTAAATAWNQAAEAATAIHASREEALPALLEAGERALASGDQQAAIQAFQTALAIDPANTTAGQGLKRARVLDRVLAALAKGAQLEAEGAFAAARLAYTEALTLDPQAAGAREAVSRLDAAIADEAFNNLLEQARQQLADDQLDDALTAVRKALDLRPNHPDAITLGARIARRQQEVAATTKFAIGAAAEKAEDWQLAYEAYSTAVKLDPALSKANAAAERVKRRHEIATRINQYLTTPDSLLAPETRRNAALLVAEVANLDANQVPELAAAADRLDLALRELSAPIPVTLSSDGVTQVTILKVQRLGSFASKTINLPPGNYVATGFRNGYQDVRVPFTLKPGDPPPTIHVACTTTF